VEAWAAAATSPVASAAAAKASRRTKTANKLGTTTMWIDQQELARSLAEGGQSRFIANCAYNKDKFTDGLCGGSLCLGSNGKNVP
jgi:hypothetical protein